LVPLFAVFFLVFPLRDVLVLLHPLGRLPRFVEIMLARVFGAHRDMRQQALEIAAVAFRARRDVAGPYDLLELVVAAPALVFVDRHRRFIACSTPNAQLPTSKTTAKAAKAAKSAKKALEVGNWELEVILKVR